MVTFHRENLNLILFAGIRNELLKPILNAWNIKDFTPVPRAKDKVVVDQGNRGFGATILITHVYIILREVRYVNDGLSSHH